MLGAVSAKAGQANMANVIAISLFPVVLIFYSLWIFQTCLSLKYSWPLWPRITRQ
jgi:hypothetical protein